MLPEAKYHVSCIMPNYEYNMWGQFPDLSKLEEKQWQANNLVRERSFELYKIYIFIFDILHDLNFGVSKLISRILIDYIYGVNTHKYIE